MKGHQEVDRLRKRLDATFVRVLGASTDAEVQADLAKYLCILVSGFLENAVVAFVLHFASVRSSKEVAGFVERQLDHWTNPNSEKLCRLMASFDKEWGEKTKAYLVDQRRDSLNSLVALRHRIAHGESVSTSLSQVKFYRDSVYDVVGFIAKLMGQ